MITKVLETKAKTEVAVFGAVWVDVPTDYFVLWQRDIENFEGGEAVQAIKKISAPPRIEDFATLTFPEDDLDAIPNCKLGDCEVKIDEPALVRLQSEVDWSAANARERATRLIRQLMLEGAKIYVKEGDDRFAAYRDKTPQGPTRKASTSSASTGAVPMG